MSPPAILFSITAGGADGYDYVVGDVNGSDSYNGLDITFGVAYFKGGSGPMCPDCPPCNNWNYCGDVNGSYSYNGLDITYGVSYFKGARDRYHVLTAHRQADPQAKSTDRRRRLR